MDGDNLEKITESRCLYDSVIYELKTKTSIPSMLHIFFFNSNVLFICH